MTTYTKQRYRLSEVADLLSIPSRTIKYWTEAFDALDPPVTNGGHRRYRPEDIEIVKRIDALLHERRMTVEGANKYLAQSKVPYRGYKCKSLEDALDIIGEITIMSADNPRVVNALDALKGWIKNNCK